MISSHNVRIRPPTITQPRRLPPSSPMATVFTPSVTFTACLSSSSPPKPPVKAHPKPLSSTFTSLTLATTIVLSSPALADPPTGFHLYYGTAASAASYGGFGGNASKKDTAEYTYEVPDGWKERLVTKVTKGTNGTDSEFYNPKKRAEREYLTFLAGLRSLAPIDAVLGNLALSDVELQDLIAGAEAVRSAERREGGQLYYTYEIDGVAAHSLISVTYARNKLYAHFVMAPTPEWNRDEAMLRQVHESFKTVGEY